MAWSDLSPETREIAQRVCTREQLEVLKLKAGGIGFRTIGLALGISREAAKDRFRRAEANIRQERERLERAAP
jgi:DNA-binding CsgD family transcriptional regulator